MWILTQDRDEIIYTKNIQAIDNKISAFSEDGEIETILGYYNSNARAKKILLEIFKRLEMDRGCRNEMSKEAIIKMPKE